MSPRIFFTSDTHFNHIGIIGHCNRPFTSVEEMNEAMIANWNDAVGKGDIVFHLGDFCWHERDAKDFFNRLNGDKHLIAGNHDHKRVRKLPWKTVTYAQRLKFSACQIYLSHYPVLGFQETFHFHGHQHNPKPSIRRRQADVGVDAWGYRPVLMRDAIRAANAGPDDRNGQP